MTNGRESPPGTYESATFESGGPWRLRRNPGCRIGRRIGQRLNCPWRQYGGDNGPILIAGDNMDFKCLPYCRQTITRDHQRAVKFERVDGESARSIRSTQPAAFVPRPPTSHWAALSGRSRSFATRILSGACSFEKRRRSHVQLEDGQSSLNDLLAAQAIATPPHRGDENWEAIKHVRALNYGLERPRVNRPCRYGLSVRLPKSSPEGVRGPGGRAGEIRDTQNWIGPGGCAINQAISPGARPANCRWRLTNWTSLGVRNATCQY